MIWNLRGTDTQNAIIQTALSRCTFPFELLLSGLQAQQGKSTIPVEWADLSVYGIRSFASVGHDHVFDNFGDEAHPLEWRGKVLGLAWYSGKISMDISLEDNHELAHEVFLSEVAHMVDFFYMTDDKRDAIYQVYHGNSEVHGHGWFDSGSYEDWVGESFMNTFCLAYSDVIPKLDFFTHKSTPEVVISVRNILTPIVEEPAVKQNFFRKSNSKIVHDNHARIRQDIWYATLIDALTEGCKPCKVCKPRDLQL